jgi:SOS-response transcriptional repressor LexA
MSRDDLEQREEPAREPVALTERQRDVLVAIDAHEKKYGVTPSYKELAEALGLPPSSKSWIKTMLDALELKGWITRAYLDSGIRPARSIKVLHRPTPAAFVRVDALLVLLVLAVFVLVTRIGVQKVDGFAADVRDARDNARACVATLERAADRLEQEKCEEPEADAVILAGELACRCWNAR